MIKNFGEVIELAKQKGPKTISVAVAQDPVVLAAIKGAHDLGIAHAILVGDKDLIEKAAKEVDLDLSSFEIEDVKGLKEASERAVDLIREGRAQLVMKGLVDTSIILKAVLRKEAELRTGKVLSHVAVFDLENYHKILFLTDAAMNIAPTLEQKKQIIENCIEVAHGMDIKEPKVAVICAKEKVNEKMPATVEAKALEEMNLSGELSGCIVGGPFALDNAISEEAAKHKGIDHSVAGDADVLMMPDIEAGNILYKSMTYFAKSNNAGVIVGAKVPIVLTSRADSDEAKLNSIALGVLTAK
ncbi:MAG: phosphate butyryltransferase [Tissierellales bacterium]|jgi:phosphate butyryltransferase|nr:phosphate butyryltransferase [Tissierellales bacterium]